MVVRLTEGRDAIRAYVSEHAGRGRDHVVALVTADHHLILQLVADLTEEEAQTVTPGEQWRVIDVMTHLAASLDRSQDRLQKLSAGQPFVPPAGVVPGGMGSAEYASFRDLRCRYIDGIADILAVLRRADPTQGLDLTAEHAQFGPFNWLGWALYSHHIHAHDHVGQIGKIREGLRVDG